MGIAGAGVGSMIGPIIDAASTALETYVNVRESKKARKWAERMANTAHQREVADLRAAGLNPILSARLGGSATPPAAVARAASAGSPGTAAVSGAVAAMRVKMENERLEAEKRALNMQAFQSMTAGNLNRQKIQESQASVDYTDQQRKLMEFQESEARANSEFWSAGGAAGKAAREVAPWLRYIFR